jgi:two-component SAPR family response regulator
MEAFVLTGIGDIYTELQAYDQAVQAYQMAEGIAGRTQEHFLQVYIKVQTAALAGLRGDLPGGYNLIKQAQQLVGPEGSEMEHGLYELEFAGLKVLENKGREVIPVLERVAAYFDREGHKVQSERAHLYLMLVYQAIGQTEKLIEHSLIVLSCLDNEFPQAALIAAAARFRERLKLCQVDYLADGFKPFFDQIEGFLDKLPGLRRYLREHARAVPFAQPMLHIRAMGKMLVQVQDRVVTSSDWQTQAARDLFFMLLAHPEGLTKEEICLNFWPDATLDEVRFRFKNTIYRLRRALGKNSILLEQEIYRFNNTLDYDYDVELFLKENALAIQARDPLQKLTHFREAIKYYRGNYLPDIEENWVFAPRECLRQNFLNILLSVSEIYLNLSNYELALDYCQRALHEDDLLEEAYRLSLRIFSGMGNRAALVRQYQRCVEVLEREINALPSPQTQALYQELLK